MAQHRLSRRASYRAAGAGACRRRAGDIRAQREPAGAAARPDRKPPGEHSCRPIGTGRAFRDGPRHTAARPRHSRSATPTAVPSTQPGGPFGTIAFIGRSAALTPATKAELDQIAKRIADQKLRHIELRAFAADSGPDSRKIALARALVVRSYLMDKGVKSRIEVGSFSGDGDSVDILVPNT